MVSLVKLFVLGIVPPTERLLQDCRHYLELTIGLLAHPNQCAGGSLFEDHLRYKELAADSLALRFNDSMEN